MEPHDKRTVLVANPACDVYGSDLQMVETVRGLLGAGWRVVVASPSDGPLAARLSELGAELRLVEYPVLKRADATLAGLAGLARRAALAMPRMCRLIAAVDPDVVYVNTVTIPWWLVAARASRRRTVCHVHEADTSEPRAVRTAMIAPLRMAHRVVVNSRVTFDNACQVVPSLRSRTTLVYNGIEPPQVPPLPVEAERDRHRLVVVGRISPRKAPHVALEAVAILRERGHDVSVEVCGTPVPNQQAYADTLVERARHPDLVGTVDFGGYTDPIWSALERSDIFVATSTGESFGNAVVEAQLAMRPVVATAVVGHLETVVDGRTGLLTPVHDASSLADAVERLIKEPGLADCLARNGRTEALRRFTSDRYRREMVAVLAGAAPTRQDTPVRQPSGARQ